MLSIFDEVPNRNDMAELIHEVRAGNGLAVELAQALNQRIDQEAKKNRKKRRKEVRSWMIAQNDRFSVVRQYDDDTQNIEDLTLNVIPDYQTFHIKFNGINDEFFYVGFYFKSSDFWIFGVKEKIDGKFLYNAMIANGIVFNARIRQGMIQDLLFRFFKPEIAKSKKSLEIPALGGWFNKIFYYKNVFMFREEEGLPMLPIHKKSLSEYEKNEGWEKQYFDKINQIADWEIRLLVVTYSLGGMLSSLLEEDGLFLEKFLNFVLLSDVRIGELTTFFQIFNRKKLEFKEPSIEKALESKDEVFLLDARPDDSRTSYKQKQQENKCKGIAEKIVKRECTSDDGYVVSCPVAVFSDHLSRSRYACNIFIDEFMIQKSNGKDEMDVIGVFFYQIAKFCEKKFDIIKELFRKAVIENHENAWFYAAFRVYEKFWFSLGFDVRERLNLPQEINFDELLKDMMTLNDDFVDDFVTVIRRGISNFSVKEKRRGEKIEGYICYSEEDLLIPTDILNHILETYGLLREKKKILSELRTKGYLTADDGGYSKQVKSGEKRIEVVQIKRRIFERQGLADIIDLGKERKGDD